MKLIKKLSWLILLLIVSGVIFSLGYYFAVTKDVSLEPEKLLLREENVILYDHEGNPIYGVANDLFKQTTAIEDIPAHTKQAFIDTEDKRFYTHRGYDLRRILRASINNLKSRSFKEGASTISQQLIKNTHLTQEKTIKRKLKEWKLTRALEKGYSKDEILERYLNTIYFGHGCFGITSACEFYFDKTPPNISLSESAILAGLVKSPNNYSPFKNPENCSKRKSVVLSVMQKNGSITETQKLDALHESLPTLKEKKNSGNYAQFVFDELSSLAEKYAFKVGGKIEIFTYFNKTLQKEVDEILEGYTESDKLALILDRETLGFKACGSTVGNIRRLPGSLIKPLLVYTPALEENLLSPATPILDTKINYSGYAPENYDGKYHGYVSARECVEKSLNIPAVKTLESLGIQKGAAYLERLGLPVLEEDKSLALALGGMKNGFTLKSMIAAYSTLQNQGELGECGFISSININGVPVYTKSKSGKRVFSEESAALMTDMLKSTVQKGTAKKLRALPFEIAAKTGTVGTEKGNTDAYALSYTTRDCVGVWLGNADNTAVDYTGGGLPCNILQKINEVLYENYQKEGKAISRFSSCTNVAWVDLDKTAYYDTHTLMLADDIAPETYRIRELFKNSAIPLYKSTSFSNPAILPPTLSLENNRVSIHFDKHSPTYYQYRIERYDYVTHTTVYEGKLPCVFTDEKLSNNKSYVYTVIPLYNDIEGAPVILPTVTTKAGNLSVNDDKILSKEWWDY